MSQEQNLNVRPVTPPQAEEKPKSAATDTSSVDPADLETRRNFTRDTSRRNS
jgi:hypothetical protein